MKPRPKILRIALATAATLILLAALFLQWRYGVFFAGPRLDRLNLVSEPGIVAVVDPAIAVPLIGDIIEKETGYRVPAAVIERILPYEAALLTQSDHNDDRINVTAYVNTRRLGRDLANQLNQQGLLDRLDKINWSPDGFTRETAGIVRANGFVPMEREAREAAWYYWKQTLKPKPLTIEGGHLFEAVFDNRDGDAYLAIASLLHTFDIDLDEKETDISLSSLQFVLKARLTADLVPEDALHIHMRIDIKPEAIDRLGVINLKAGIEELFYKLSERLYRDHGFELQGRGV